MHGVECRSLLQAGDKRFGVTSSWCQRATCVYSLFTAAARRTHLVSKAERFREQTASLLGHLSVQEPLGEWPEAFSGISEPSEIKSVDLEIDGRV